jgi:hypothetical protein
MAKSINQLKQLAEELSAEEELRAATALRKQAGLRAAESVHTAKLSCISVASL